MCGHKKNGIIADESTCVYHVAGIKEGYLFHNDHPLVVFLFSPVI